MRLPAALHRPSVRRGCAARGRHRQKRGPVQLPSQCTSELHICHRIRRGDIHRAGQPVIAPEQTGSPRSRPQTNPAHPLTPVSKPRTQTKAEQRQHLLQCAVARPQHDSETQMHDADACLNGGFCGSLPLPAEIGQKARAGRRRFRQQFVSRGRRRSQWPMPRETPAAEAQRREYSCQACALNPTGSQLVRGCTRRSSDGRQRWRRRDGLRPRRLPARAGYSMGGSALDSMQLLFGGGARLAVAESVSRGEQRHFAGPCPTFQKRRSERFAPATPIVASPCSQDASFL